MVFLDVISSKYDQFGGRAGRREYWLFMLAYSVALVVALAVDGLITSALGMAWYDISSPIFAVCFTLTLVPVFALSTRRLHDTGRSGRLLILQAFWIPAALFFVSAAEYAVFPAASEIVVFVTLGFVFLVPALVGVLVMLVIALIPSNEAENEYGQAGASTDRPPVFWTVLTTRYSMFSGRASREEFWLFAWVAFNIVSLAFTFDSVVFTGLAMNGIYPIAMISILASIVPGIALVARRFHDIGRSGWWQLPWWVCVISLGPLLVVLGFIRLGPTVLGLTILALIGSIVPFTWLFKRSQEGENKHGGRATVPG